MLGTIVNAAAIVLGGVIGLFLKGGLPDKYRDNINHVLGISVFMLGVSGAAGKMILPEANPVLFIISLLLGGIVGVRLDLEGKLKILGDWLQNKVNAKKERGSISSGFVAGSLIFCSGTMSILGSIESGIQGDHSVLFAKALLDAIIALVMASTMGLGVVFGAGTVLVYQGTLTLLAGFIAPAITADMMREISIIGGVVLTAFGLNMLELTKIKIANLLPAMVVPVIYYLVVGLLPVLQ